MPAPENQPARYRFLAKSNCLYKFTENTPPKKQQQKKTTKKKQKQKNQTNKRNKNNNNNKNKTNNKQTNKQTNNPLRELLPTQECCLVLDWRPSSDSTTYKKTSPIRKYSNTLTLWSLWFFRLKHQNMDVVPLASRMVPRWHSHPGPWQTHKQGIHKLRMSFSLLFYPCQKFHDFIYGWTVQVETDHELLVTTVKKPLHTDAPARL